MSNSSSLSYDYDYDWGLQCPPGFVVPDGLGEYTTVLNSPCAKGCRVAYWSEKQFHIMDFRVPAIALGGFVSLTVILFFWLREPSRCARQYLALSIMFFSCLTSLGYSLSMFYSHETFIKYLCPSNTEGMAQTGGPNSSVCTVQGAITAYGGMSLSLSWLAQAIDLYLKLVRGMKSTDRYFWYYIALIVVYPPILLIIYAGTDSYGYNGTVPFCTQRVIPLGSLDVPFIFLYIPMAIIVICGILCLLLVLQKFIKVWGALRSFSGRVEPQENCASGTAIFGTGELTGIVVHSSKNKLVPGGLQPTASAAGDAGSNSVGEIEPDAANKLLYKSMNASAVLLIFCVAFLLVWLSLFAYKMKSVLRTNAIAESYSSWVHCMFDNYDGITDASATSVCGEQPEYYKGVWPLYLFALSVGCGQSFFVVLGFGPQVLAPLFCRCLLKKSGERDREIVRILEIRANRAAA